MTDQARDGYERYYSEKLWQLVPEVYRHEDGLGPRPHALRQIVELIGEQAAESRRSIDRLWEDQHIETCDDWAVPYIGELVGARLVSARDRRGRRVDVANTIKYRRRRGTPDLLDTLVRAMSGWDVVLVEGFRRLARTRHRLDLPPRAEGRFTGTVSGGTADLRRPAGAEIVGSPFDEFFHLLDTRRLTGRAGRFGIRKLNFHLYRLRAYEMRDVDPTQLADVDGLGWPRTFTCDPSGRDVPLWINAEPPVEIGAGIEAITREQPVCVAPAEWQVTQPMRCRLLGHEAYEMTASDLEELKQLGNSPAAADEVALLKVLGHRFGSETALRRRLRDLGATIADNPPTWYRALVGLSLVEETGKAQLYPAQVELSSDGTPLATAQISAGNLSQLACHPAPTGNLARALISPAEGRFASLPPNEATFLPRVARYHYGFSSDVGAGPYPRAAASLAAPARTAADGTVPDGGVLREDGLRIEDNRTYALAIRSDTPLSAAAIMQAGAQSRPYVRLSGDTGNTHGANLRPAATGHTFVVDGGWYASSAAQNELTAGEPADFVIEAAEAGVPGEYDFERLEIHFATFDPGGLRADGIRIPALRLLVRAQIKTLIVRRSIMGPIEVLKDDAADPAHVDELIICDSIVDAQQTTAGVAISNLFGKVVLEGTTVFGDVRAARLEASESLIAGQVQVVNNQDGCFRFSGSEPGPDSRLPPRFRDVHGQISPAYFNSKRFGDPQYAQLSVVAPVSISQGAEDGSEMGAFSHLITPIRLQSVRAKVDEYGPVGLLAQYLFEGDHLAESLVQTGVLNHDPPPLAPFAPPDPGPLIPPPPDPAPPPLPTSCEDELTSPPLADAGDDQNVLEGSAFTLDGGRSRAGPGHTLDRFVWTLTDRP